MEEFNFEVPCSTGRNRIGKHTGYISVTSYAKNVRLKSGEVRSSRELMIIFSQEATMIMQKLGGSFSIAFDDKNNKIALKPNTNGWRLQSNGSSKNSKALRIARSDKWSLVQNIEIDKKIVHLKV